MKTGEHLIWTVPCFPVLTINFITAEIELNSELFSTLFKEEYVATRLGSLPTTIDCLSSWNIMVNDVTYQVLWEWSAVLADSDNDDFDFLASLSSLHNANPGQLHHEVDMLQTPALVIQDHDDEENSEHELPFKVMGATGNGQIQDYLDHAFEKMYGDEQANVDVRIKADPTNAYDANTICVQINYGQGWKLVGFLLKDCTIF